MTKFIVVYLIVNDVFTIFPDRIRCCRLENILRIAGAIIPGSSIRLHGVAGDTQTLYRFRTVVVRLGWVVYGKCLTEHQHPLRVGEADHFVLHLLLQGEETKYPHPCQQALDKCQVVLLILISLLASWIVLLQTKLIFSVMQVTFLQYLLHHLRYRFVHEKTMTTRLFIQ